MAVIDEETYINWLNTIVKHFQEQHKLGNRIENEIEEVLKNFGLDYYGQDYAQILEKLRLDGIIEKTGNGEILTARGKLFKVFEGSLIKNPENAKPDEVFEAIIKFLRTDKSNSFHINDIFKRLPGISDVTINLVLNSLIKEDLIHKEVHDVFGVDFTFYSMSLYGNEIIDKHQTYSNYLQSKKEKETGKENKEETSWLINHSSTLLNLFFTAIVAVATIKSCSDSSVGKKDIQKIERRLDSALTFIKANNITIEPVSKHE